MLRRLLACLALITGLAAVYAPAHASIAGAVGPQLELSHRAEDGARNVEPACAERQRQQRIRGSKIEPCSPAEPITILVPTVQFGADRAYE